MMLNHFRAAADGVFDEYEQLARDCLLDVQPTQDHRYDDASPVVKESRYDAKLVVHVCGEQAASFGTTTSPCLGIV